MMGCECEHESHMPGEETETGIDIPPDGHQYGSMTEPGSLVTVRTIYGTVQICEWCQLEHPIPDSLLAKPEGRCDLDPTPHAENNGCRNWQSL